VETEDGSNPDRERSTTVVDISVEIQKKLHYRQKASLVMAGVMAQGDEIEEKSRLMVGEKPRLSST